MTEKIKWEILSEKKVKEPKKSVEDIINVLLKNRGLRVKTEADEFFNPKHPNDIDIKKLGIRNAELKKAIKRIKKALKENENICVYGDYDADGVCATAICWESLYSVYKNVSPFIPSRFDEGYGLNAESVKKIAKDDPNLKLIITVDNGIVSHDGVKKANELGIDVIITDHHQKQKKLPKALAVIHTDKLSGSGVAWIFAKEVLKKIGKDRTDLIAENTLELAAIGTIADQLPLIGACRSIAKYGLESLNSTKRPGLISMFEEAGISGSEYKKSKNRKISTYDVNYIIAPRINAMGRMEHAIDSLRLICTKDIMKAKKLARSLGFVNKERQKRLEEVLSHAKEIVKKSRIRGAILVSHESYHEGLIGLIASKLVEEHWRPAIVFSKGETISKASARSISGFNIIESIKKLDEIIIKGGGHPMAAGFSIETKKIDLFEKEFQKIANEILTDEMLTKSIKIDLEIEFSLINQMLYEHILKFEPFGVGNNSPLFATKDVVAETVTLVGNEGQHLKMTLGKNGKKFPAIAFGKGNYINKIQAGLGFDIAYGIEANTWNGKTSLQLKVKDINFK
jgi:single-stranded-DNA-specific exonuclease